MAEDRTEAHSAGSVSDTLTISEAAALLGIHKNTVRNRIKDGTYEAEQVLTERGPTYFIKRESIVNNLTTDTISSTSQDIVSPQALEFVQELLRPFVNEVGQAREDLGTERARRQMAEERVAELEEELEALRSPPPAKTDEAENVPDSPEIPGPIETPAEGAERLQEDTEAPTQRRGFFSRLFGR